MAPRVLPPGHAAPTPARFGFIRTRKAQEACFYFHFTASEAVVLGGVYSPEVDELPAYRNLVAQNHKEFQNILRDKRLKTLAGGLHGEKFKRMPKGFSASHPAADLLRRKQWYVVTMLQMGLLSTAELLPTLVKHFETMAPFVEFLNRSLAPQRKTRKPLLRSFANGEGAAESRL